jgi:hypothetical protein
MEYTFEKYPPHGFPYLFVLEVNFVFAKHTLRPESQIIYHCTQLNIHSNEKFLKQMLQTLIKHVYFMPCNNFVFDIFIRSFINYKSCYVRSRNNSVSLVTELLVGRPGFDSRQERNFSSWSPRLDMFWDPLSLLFIWY